MFNKLSTTIIFYYVLHNLLLFNIHRLRHGLPWYLIMFAPHAFVSQRQSSPRLLLSLFGVPSSFLTFYRYTRHSVILLETLE